MKDARMSWRAIFSIISTIAGIYIGFLTQKPVSSLCDPTECPYCYGDDLCGDVEENKINLRYGSFSDAFNNLFGVKNVYFADYGGVKVVLKKLGHRSELARMTKKASEVKIFEQLNSAGGALKACDPETSELLVEKSRRSFGLEQLWSVLQINSEPLILRIFERQDDWPVPELYGACGLLIVEEHCGQPLNNFRTSDWHDRAFLALQLVEAAVNFTRKHADFRMYLTDISPDNIAVDDDFNLCFIDLENVILKQKLADEDSVHYSEHFDEDDFVYDEGAVCQSSMSDHNVYAVCRLLLSRRAPWPMMRNGLLHSAPPNVVVRYDELFALIEECVDSDEKLSRFYIAEELIRLLKEATESH
ncbi:deleted in autism protein 1 -like [Asbolus verrucosus]|uniref:Deleted in autism protein 1-like n=1 Tax=Asbolus verrucosus TaxID=1661398 RepID=A0A482VNB9_ASBVE|nr:deleted in autism protein 1 -like [Asbolus verrucosus]